MTVHMPGSAETSLRALELLVRHVRAVNATSRGEGAADLSAGITDDCVMRFEGIAVGPFEGRDAVVAAYTDSPPGSEILVLDTSLGPDGIAATYAWIHDPAKPAGRLTLTLRDDLVSTFTVDYWSD